MRIEREREVIELEERWTDPELSGVPERSGNTLEQLGTALRVGRIIAGALFVVAVRALGVCMAGSLWLLARGSERVLAAEREIGGGPRRLSPMLTGQPHELRRELPRDAGTRRRDD